ncbi:MAG: bifunctional (p)ppGpp synthetase/guanosine-3',5'-bis(diphosphate) 3'-pyrophosphohydrolase [Myxococcales bacterium FL481]|nr:MAG: bifunctional (p)ppGpp synthetase/guanosine-3',5'-bis(diphosphate) 3'-pyrophosphohydrolase [Myxococcales bacterium FL481]
MDSVSATRSPERSMFDEQLARIRQEVRAHRPNADLGSVQRAFELAERSHAGQRRRSGEPYLMHPLRVATTIAGLGLDVDTVTAGILHDAVEDSEVTVVELTERFGRAVANVVDGVTKLGKIPYLSRQEQQAESFRKMLLAMSRDIRVLLVKLADRLDNMRTLAHMPADKQLRIARETMDIYAPLAGRLSLPWLREQLEDLSFRYLEPASFAAVVGRRDALLQEKPDFLDETSAEIATAFTGPVDIGGGDKIAWDTPSLGPVEVAPILRGIYQLHVTEQSCQHEIDQLFQIVRYDVVTRDRTGCYAALGQLHAAFKPMPGRFQDHIALPSSAGRQGLATVVVISTGARVDVQIRSKLMADRARRGVVTALDDSGSPRHVAGDLGWLTQIMDWQDEISDPHEFIEAIKGDLFADEVYVFTPRGDIITLPRGSTPIDFAFAVHTELGLRCSGARINGQIVPLRYRLRQGDTVEVLPSPHAQAKPQWLAICKSARALARIRQYLRQRERVKLVEAGRRSFEQAAADERVDLQDPAIVDRLEGQCEVHGVGRERGIEGLYEDIAAGRVDVDAVVRGLVAAPRSSDPDRTEDSGLLRTILRRVKGSSAAASKPRLPAGQGGTDHPIVITRDSLSEAWLELSSCCDPLPGDPLLGYLAAGRGVLVHTQSCPVALTRIEGRRVFVTWEEGLRLERPATLEVRTGDEPGLLAAMSRAFSQRGINIKQAHCRTDGRATRAVNTFHMTVNSLEELTGLQRDLAAIPGVFAVDRVYAAEGEPPG